VAGLTSLFVYLLPANEGLAALLGMIVMIWQGILLWKTVPEETPATEMTET
jgi:hypothetical protein